MVKPGQHELAKNTSDSCKRPCEWRSPRLSALFLVRILSPRWQAPTVAVAPQPASSRRLVPAKPLRSLTDIDLRGGRSYTDEIIAFCGTDRLSTFTDAHLAVASWYRVRDGAHFAPIEGVSGGQYRACLDDVGSRILCRCREIANPSNSGFGELGPLAVDPDIAARAQQIADDAASDGLPAEAFYAGEGGAEAWRAVTLVLSSDAVRVVSVPTLRAPQQLLAEPETPGQPSISEAEVAGGAGDSSAGTAVEGGSPSIPGGALVAIPAARFALSRILLSSRLPLELTLTFAVAAVEEGARVGSEKQVPPEVEAAPTPVSADCGAGPTVVPADSGTAALENSTSAESVSETPADGCSSADIAADAGVESTPCSVDASKPADDVTSSIVPAESSAARGAVRLRFSSSAARDVAALALRRVMGLDLYGRDVALDAPSPADLAGGAASVDMPLESPLRANPSSSGMQPGSPLIRGASSSSFPVDAAAERDAEAMPASSLPDSNVSSITPAMSSMPPEAGVEGVVELDSLAALGAESATTAAVVAVVELGDGLSADAAVSDHPATSSTDANAAAVEIEAAEVTTTPQVAQGSTPTAPTTGDDGSAVVASLRASLASAQAANERKSVQISALQKTASAAELRISALSSALSSRDATIARLQQESQAALSRCDVATASAHAKVVEIKRLTAQLATLSADAAALKQRHAVAVEQLEASKAALSAAKSDAAASGGLVPKLQHELRALSGNFSTVRSERDAARADAKELQEKLESLRTELGAKARAASKAVAELEALRPRAEALQAERDALQAELREAAVARNEARAVAAAAEAAATQAQLAQDASEKEATAIRVERDDLRAALQLASARSSADAADSRAARELSEAANARAMAVAAELDATRTRLAEQARVVEALAREKSDALARAASLEAELGDARSRTVTAESKLKRLTAAVDASKTLQAQVATLQEQLDAVTSERNAAVKKAESLRRDVSRMTASSDELKSLDIPELVRAKKALEEKVVRMTAEVLELKERLEQQSQQVQPALPASPMRTAAGGGGGGISSTSAASASYAVSGGGGFSSSSGAAVGKPVPPAPSSGGGGGGAGDESGKVRELQRLANSLLEQLSDSADALQQHRATKEALARRIHELEDQLARRG